MKNIIETKKHLFFRFTDRRGFTLVEILVAVSLFAFTILMATGVFSAVMEGQRSALASQNIQESIRYALEVMSKEIRMAQASDGACNALFNPQPTPANKIYNLTLDVSGNQILYFKNQNDNCVAYYLTDKKINIMRNYNTGAITSALIKINSLKFSVIDNAIGSSNSVQPIVSIKIDASINEGSISSQKINIQTSVSSREYAANTVNVSDVYVSDCIGPDGATILNGSSKTYYLTSSVAYGSTCSSELRTCANGTLSGAYTFDSCSVDTPTYQSLVSNTSGLVSYWKMDGDWADSIGGNNGTAIGATFGTAKYGSNSGSFNGASNVTTGGTSLPIGASARTIEFWAKTTKSSTSGMSQPVLWWGAQSANKLNLITLDIYQKADFYGYSADLDGTVNIISDTWTHVAVTYDGTTVKIYVNGALDTSGARTLDTSLSGIIMGYYSGWGKYFLGSIDEVAIYNRALSATEISEHYNAGN